MQIPRRSRILIVEDVALLALDLERIVLDLGGVVAGTASSCGRGVEMARKLDLDAAILDVDLRGQRSDPIADVLAKRSIPFAFLTALDTHELPDGHRHRPHMAKPCTPRQIANLLATLLSAGAAKNTSIPHFAHARSAHCGPRSYNAASPRQDRSGRQQSPWPSEPRAREAGHPRPR
jgi:CheY-like chemotaxis protein